MRRPNLDNLRARFKREKTDGQARRRIGREAAALGFIFILLAVVSLSGSSGITGFAVLDDISEALDSIEAPEFDLPAEEAESAPVQPEGCGEHCGLGNVPVREEGPLTSLDTSEDQASLFVSSNPEHGATVSGLGDITVTSSTEMIAGSYIKLHQGNENRMVDRGYTTIDGNTMTTAAIVNTLGSYKAEYKIVTDSGVEEEGQFSFTVA
jgi:hypothetical protein